MGRCHSLFYGLGPCHPAGYVIGSFLILKKKRKRGHKNFGLRTTTIFIKEPPFLSPNYNKRIRIPNAINKAPVRINASFKEANTASTIPKPKPEQHHAQQLQSINRFFIRHTSCRSIPSIRKGNFLVPKSLALITSSFSRRKGRKRIYAFVLSYYNCWIKACFKGCE